MGGFEKGSLVWSALLAVSASQTLCELSQSRALDREGSRGLCPPALPVQNELMGSWFLTDHSHLPSIFSMGFSFYLVRGKSTIPAFMPLDDKTRILISVRSPNFF